MGSKPRLLCVDDEQDLLDGLRLSLRRKYRVTTATSGAEALELFDRPTAAEGDGDDAPGPADGTPPFDVVVSDMRMPGMSGAEFLSTLRDRHPDIPRLLLSGQADLESAIAAINEARIFRFLSKPCPADVLADTIDEALDQARLRRVERELLNDTLSGTVSMLTDVVGLVNPGAYGRTMRLQDTVTGLCEALDRPKPWDLDVATMLSQIGFVVIPPEEGEDGSLQDRHTDVARDLIAKIPRLETAATIVGHQLAADPAVSGDEPGDWSDADLSAEMLRVAVRLDQLVTAGRNRDDAVAELRSEASSPRFLVDALARLDSGAEPMVTVETKADKLAAGMTLAADVQSITGVKLAGEGMVLTSALVGRIRSFASGTGVVEPIAVLVPASAVAKLAA